MNETIQEQLDVLKREMFESNTIDRSVENKERINKLMSRYDNNNKLTNETEYKKERKKAKRSEIWYVDFGQRHGSLQSGIRPALVESNDINNKYSNIINVYPLTSSMSKASIPVHVPIEGFNLKEKSIILVEQGTPIDVRFQLLTYIGTVNEIVMKKVERARNIQLGDLQPKTPLEKLEIGLRKKIEEKLDDIYTFEKAISKASNRSLINNLLEQREAFLWSLQNICENNKLNYRDYYKKYEAEKEVVAM